MRVRVDPETFLSDATRHKLRALAHFVPEEQ